MAMSSLEEAVTVIRLGGVVAFPTETYYGLAVDPENEDALRKLYRVKQRHSVKPILVLLENVQGLESIASAVPDIYLPLMERYWPGPLTLIFPAKKELSSTLTGGTNTVGVRVSPHPLAISLVKKMGNPVTATSANLSGRTPASSPREVKDIFGERVDYILDGGETAAGKPSTLVGIRQGKLTVLREGQLNLPGIAVAPPGS